jgi:formate dehydrogenase maturation protein FdhE
MTQPLTAEQVTAYVHNGYAHCPFCQSPDISGGHVEVEANQAWQRVSCSACDAEWQDVYQLIGVDLTNDDGEDVFLKAEPEGGAT